MFGACTSPRLRETAMVAKRRLTPLRVLKVFALLTLTVVTFFVLHRIHVDKYALHSFIRIPNILPLRNINLQNQENLKKSRCTLRRLLRETKSSELAACRRVQPVPGSCDEAEQLFHSKSPATCHHQRKLELCKINQSAGGFVQCQADICLSLISVGTVCTDNGRVKWQKFNSTSSAEKYISSLLHPSTHKLHFGFCYVACETVSDEFRVNNFINQFWYDDDFHELEAVQILLLPPSHAELPVHSSRDGTSRVNKNVNINMIFTDSVSHQHFLRSLPQTVKLLQTLHQNMSHKVSVMEFDLVQGVRSRTFETLQLLFSGRIDPSARPFSTLELPPEPLKTEVLLQRLKQEGYTTLWLEDMCYRWEWGLSKDLRVFNKSLSREESWDRLQKALVKAGIDSMEVTLAMCKILNDNGVPDIFHGPDAVCYNGKHQHEYLFDYLLLYQKEMLDLKQSFFTFLETNIGHEDTGLRVQSLDSTLSSYLQQAAQQENTLTVLFSDHGNAYGMFVEKSMEGHIEMFHPYIFLIIPENVASHLGSASMSALLINQHRLISHLDLHYTLKALVTNFTLEVDKGHDHYEVKRWGLLEIVSPNRTCDHIPRIMPNLCICTNFDMEVRKDSYHALFAHLALGLLNNEIQHQFHQGWSDHGLWRGFGHCQQIYLVDFTNIRKTFHGNNTITLKMDILALPKELAGVYRTNSSSVKPEVFFISILARLDDNQIFLEKVDRLTPYSQVAKCADKSVDLKLCVCDSKVNNSLLETELRKTKDFSMNENLEKNDIYLHTHIYSYASTNECLLLIERKNQHGGLFFVANVCPTKIFHVQFSLQTVRMHVSTQNSPVQGTVYPGQEILLCMAVQKSPKPDWSWSFSSQYSEEII